MSGTVQGIAFIGLGAMGYGMAANIRKKMPPEATLYVFDMSKTICELFRKQMIDVGPIAIVNSPREAAESSHTVVSIVPGANEVRQVYLHELSGVIAATRNPERLLLECSTIDVQSSRAVGEALLLAGAGTFIDTPVSGGVPAAELGTLSFLIGHSKPSDTNAVSCRLETIVSMMGSPQKLFYCGKPGAGLAAKISNNYLSCSILLAVAEAMAIGVRSGVEPKLLHDIIHNSTGQTFMADNVQPVPGVVAHAPSSNNYQLGFKTQMMIKDLSLGVQAGHEVGIRPSIAEAALRVFEKAAVDPQCIDRDGSSVYLHLTKPPAELENKALIMSSSQIALPTSTASVDVKLLNGGSMTAEYHKLHAGEPAIEFRMYNWCFLIRHATQDRWVLWDLGLSANKDDYPPVIAQGPITEAAVQDPREKLAAQIKRRSGASPDQIDTILLSHAHFDHCRPVSGTFPNATVFFGPGTSEYCFPGHLSDPSSMWDGRYFDPERATECWKTLEGPWIPFGSFKRAMDFFGDGSFWVIEAPGHMPGNLCACARLENGEWVMLGSDCCHSRVIFDGLKDFGTFELPDGGVFCLHEDTTAARDTLARMRIMEELGVHIALAHDASWMEEENDAVLLSLLDKKFREDARMSLRSQKPF
ncbi:3-hydroxyisobutyrate dehydrogenase [Penicillium rolfsii]|nr:3-hydroxyisobutyrate dehydrogenase [Penicillium rolfsii]